MYKSKTTAVVLSVFLGILGIHRFYLGYIGTGILKLCTGGLFGILYLVDIILIATGSLKPRDGSPYEEDLGQQNYQPPYEQPQQYYEQQGYGAPSREESLDDLKRYKELLDTGVLTQEEFDAKKREILGL